jgi:hypothetical protein
MHPYLYQRLIETKRALATCPICGSTNAQKDVEVWEEEVIDLSRVRDDGGRYGDHPWEYGHGLFLTKIERDALKNGQAEGDKGEKKIEVLSFRQQLIGE